MRQKSCVARNNDRCLKPRSFSRLQIFFQQFCFREIRLTDKVLYCTKIQNFSLFSLRNIAVIFRWGVFSCRQYIFTSDPYPTALSDVYRLFTTIVYLAIQVACFDAIFDCITNMIGPLFYLHVVNSTPNNQAWKRRGYFIFILTVTSHFTFS